MPELPADIAAAGGFDDWRSRVWWPIPIAEANAIAAAQARDALVWAATLDADIARDAALLALPNILAYGRAILMAAVAVNRAANEGIRLIGRAPEFAFLHNGDGEISDRSAPILASGRIRHELARRIARIRSWSGSLRTAAALFAPDAVAVSHNVLLQKAASESMQAIGFRHADSILAAARESSDKPNTLDIADMASHLSSVLVGKTLLEEPYLGRSLHLLQQMVVPHLVRAAYDMGALRTARLPKRIWSGSGGLYAPRAIGLEVLRRGGDVVRFDHGKPKAFVEGREIDAVVEFSSSSKFVVATDAAAELARRHSDLSLVSWRKTEIAGISGDPTFASVPFRRAAKSGRRRVVYAPTQLLGFRQLLPVQQPDLVYLQWQMEVLEMLRELPVEFICQPHPEGLFAGQPHPLEGMADVRRGQFEEQLQHADVFVFDYPSTTAMWQAACTDAKVVYLDMGSGVMTPEVAALFAARASVLTVAFDSGNRPLLDAAALCDAVLTDTGAADPTAFRALLAGAA